MKIASIELYELRVPLKKPFTRSKKIGTLMDDVDFTHGCLNWMLILAFLL